MGAGKVRPITQILEMAKILETMIMALLLLHKPSIPYNTLQLQVMVFMVSMYLACTLQVVQVICACV